MLTLQTPFYELSGVVVFRDHAVPTTFHYLAGPPRLSVRDGKPQLSLIEYREALAGAASGALSRDQLGGGFLTLGVDCRIDEDTLTSVRRELVETIPELIEDEVSLVPVLYTSGKVRLVAVDQRHGFADEPRESGDDTPAARFVRGILGTATPSLMGDQEAIFSVALSPDGVALLEGAYREGLAPIAVLYELEFSGLRPALQVRAKVDQSKVYESLKMELQVGIESGTETDGNEAEGGEDSGPQGVALDVELSRTVESLIESGAIELEVVQLQEGETADQMRERAVELIKQDLLEELFQPTPTTRPTQPDPAAAARNAGALAASTADISRGQAEESDAALEIGFQLRYKKEEELKVKTYDYSVTRPEKRTHAPNGFLRALFQGTSMDDHVVAVKLDDPFFARLEVAVETTADFARLGLQTVMVEIQYGGTPEVPREVASLLFTPDDHGIKHFGTPIADGEASFRYRVDYRFAGGDEVASASNRFTTPWRTTTARTLVVHPPEDLDLLEVFVEQGVVNWQLVRQIEVELTYDHLESGFHRSRTFMVDSSSERQSWVLRVPAGAPRRYTARPTWGLSDGTTLRGEATEHDHAQLFVADPFTDRLRVRIVPAVDPGTVGLVIGELTHVDPESGLESRRNVTLEPPFRPTTVSIPVRDASHREYRWSYQVIPLAGGEGTRTGPIVSSAPVLVVAEGDVLHYAVEVAVVGDLEAAEVMAVQVDLRGEPPPGRQPKIHSLLFEMGGDTRVTERLALRSDRDPVYEYQATVMTMSGDSVVGEWTPHAGPVLGLDVARLLAPEDEG